MDPDLLTGTRLLSPFEIFTLLGIWAEVPQLWVFITSGSPVFSQSQRAISKF